MPISPIQIYEPQISPLTQILQQGNQTITGIFDKAVQIGRDLSNKQLQQEQDMMAMRNSETAMSQRRAENLQQNWEDTFRMAENTRQFNVKFGADETQRQVQNDRASVQDIFSNDMEQKRLGIAQGGLDLRKQDQQLQTDSAQLERDRVASEREGVQKIFGSSGGDPNKRLGEIDAALGSKTLTMEQEAQLRGEKNTLEAEIRKSGAGGSGSPYAAEDQAMQRKAFQDSQAGKVDKTMEEKVLGNTTAFTSAQANEIKAYGDAEKVPPAKWADAQVYDKDRYVSEKASARRMTLPEYLTKGPQDEASKKAREELWRYVNEGGDGATTPAAPTTPTAPVSPVSQIPGI